MSTPPSSTTETLKLPLPREQFLRGDLTLPDVERDFAVLYVHGFGSHRQGEKVQALRTACVARDWPFAAFDFRGHGESSSTMYGLRCSRLQADLDAILQGLAGRGLRRLFLVGSSMGGWAAAWFALRHPETVPALVLLAPAFHFPHSLYRRLPPAQQQAWAATGSLRVRSEWLDVEVGHGLLSEGDVYPVERLRSDWCTPALVFHGFKDEVIPYAHTLEFVEGVPYPHIEVRLLKEGDHRLTGLKEEMAEEACRFFQRFM